MVPPNPRLLFWSVFFGLLASMHSSYIHQVTMWTLQDPTYAVGTGYWALQSGWFMYNYTTMAVLWLLFATFLFIWLQKHGDKTSYVAAILFGLGSLGFLCEAFFYWTFKPEFLDRVAKQSDGFPDYGHRLDDGGLAETVGMMCFVLGSFCYALSHDWSVGGCQPYAVGTKLIFFGFLGSSVFFQYAGYNVFRGFDSFQPAQLALWQAFITFFDSLVIAGFSFHVCVLIPVLAITGPQAAPASAEPTARGTSAQKSSYGTVPVRASVKQKARLSTKKTATSNVTEQWRTSLQKAQKEEVVAAAAEALVQEEPAAPEPVAQAAEEPAEP